MPLARVRASVTVDTCPRIEALSWGRPAGSAAKGNHPAGRFRLGGHRPYPASQLPAPWPELTWPVQADHRVGSDAAAALALAAAAISQPPENAHSQEQGACGRGHRGGVHPAGSRVHNYSSPKSPSSARSRSRASVSLS